MNCADYLYRYNTVMIDFKHLRENQALYEAGFAKKRVKIDVKKMRAERNDVSKIIPSLKDKEKQAKIAEMKKLGDKLAAAEAELNKKFVQLKELADLVPNLPHESVPEGED